MLARCVKNELRLVRRSVGWRRRADALAAAAQLLRETMRAIKVPLEQPYTQLVIDHCNRVFGRSSASTRYWCACACACVGRAPQRARRSQAHDVEAAPRRVIFQQRRLGASPLCCRRHCRCRHLRRRCVAQTAEELVCCVASRAARAHARRPPQSESFDLKSHFVRMGHRPGYAEMKPLSLLFHRLTQCTGLRFNPRIADELLRNACASLRRPCRSADAGVGCRRPARFDVPQPFDEIDLIDIGCVRRRRVSLCCHVISLGVIAASRSST